ncbi:hypothetical protein GLOIN_2v1778254 [Rhizophagus clarus]|uniref:BTB domain-containing protein n=1 Tax=Rhizophagus clarus TaxID=94130 RepID=A0A8H3LA11_9GLOM|nr:hypothetical protein GLOIN_2v1778254 [Rhizophagus clarus]
MTLPFHSGLLKIFLIQMISMLLFKLAEIIILKSLAHSHYFNCFDIALKYIYTGDLGLKEHFGEVISGLLVISDELNLEEFFEPVQCYVIRNHTIWIQENLDLFILSLYIHIYIDMRTLRY